MKIYAIGAVIVLLIFTHYKMYNMGMTTQAGIEALARQELIDTQREQVLALQAIKNKVEVKYRDKIRTIYKVVDPTGCLNRTLSDVGLLPAPAVD